MSKVSIIVTAATDLPQRSVAQARTDTNKALLNVMKYKLCPI